MSLLKFTVSLLALLLLISCESSSSVEDPTTMDIFSNSYTSLIKYHKTNGNAGFNTSLYKKEKFKFYFNGAEASSFALYNISEALIFDTTNTDGIYLAKNLDSVLVAYNELPLISVENSQSIFGSAENSTFDLAESFHVTTSYPASFTILTDSLPETFSPEDSLEVYWSRCSDAKSYEVYFKSFYESDEEEDVYSLDTMFVDESDTCLVIDTQYLDKNEVYKYEFTIRAIKNSSYNVNGDARGKFYGYFENVLQIDESMIEND